jgi:hypothetical protein
MKVCIMINDVFGVVSQSGVYEVARKHSRQIRARPKLDQPNGVRLRERKILTRFA